MKVLVTGGAGFIGRWVVKKLLLEGIDVWLLDNLSNSDKSNLEEFTNVDNYHGLTVGDVSDIKCVENIFNENKFTVCIHSAAQINVQENLDDPGKSFEVNVIGTYNVLNCALKFNTKLVLIGTCMVYDMARSGGISELSPVKPTSPYAGSKLAAENLALSYFHGYGLPVVIARPFNTYGPYQKSDRKGGVVSIFIRSLLEGETLNVFGDGTQTRDFLYVEDCADFIVKASFSHKAVGEIINAGSGRDIAIKDLALLICKNPEGIKYVGHYHPQSEIPKLLCDYSKAKKLLGWQASISLEEGIERTKEWIRSTEL